MKLFLKRFLKGFLYAWLVGTLVLGGMIYFLGTLDQCFLFGILVLGLTYMPVFTLVGCLLGLLLKLALRKTRLPRWGHILCVVLLGLGYGVLLGPTIDTVNYAPYIVVSTAGAVAFALVQFPRNQTK